MGAEWWAVIASWAGAGATGVGIWLTRRQAAKALETADDAKEAAQDQANSARDSAVSASKSADAAVQQARAANESAAAAVSQADSARDSAEAARVSAVAAVDQADIARQSLSESKDARAAAERKAEEPNFEITIDAPKGGRCRVGIRMISGPPRIGLDVTWIRHSHLPPQPIGNGKQVSEDKLDFDRAVGRHEVVRNQEIVMFPSVPDGAIDVRLRLVLSSVTDDGREPPLTWLDEREVTWFAPDRPRIF